MKYITLPTCEKRPLSFYLAMEEYVARHIDEPDAFFMWQVAPSVIFGRNQVAVNEVDLDYCREHSISVYRRKSGGGCVYADEHNVMLSFVTSGENVGFAFNRFVNMVLLVLHKMGIEATGTSRNDILIEGHKICGTACYHLAGRSIVHSTLLYDTDMAHMQYAITPALEKLQKNGIQSVRQRITLLKDYTRLSLEEVKDLFRSLLCDGERMLAADEVVGIKQLEQTYLDKQFINLLQQ